MPPASGHRDLRRIWLFAGCTRAELRTVTKVVEEVDVPAGTLLVAQGEPGLLFFVVLAGSASVVRGKRTIAHLGPGEFFGELALLDDQPRFASATADTDMTLLVLRRKQFQRVLRDSPSMARRLMSSLATRLRDVDALAYD